MENYLVINGKRVDLTEEQIKQLGLEVEKKSPFDRVGERKYYYHISSSGNTNVFYDCDNELDNELYNVANYCTNKELMTVRAKEEVLNRLLWRFSMENGGSEIDWEDDLKRKYFIFKDYKKHDWGIAFSIDFYRLGIVHFISEELARRAIDEIVKPFYAGELEVCKIWEE